MFHNTISSVVGFATAMAVSSAFAQSSSSDVRIDASQSASGSENLYLCNDESGTPVLMLSCPDFEKPAYDVIPPNPPHPPHPPCVGCPTVIGAPTAPIGTLGGPTPTFLLSDPSSPGETFGDENVSGGDSGGAI